MMGVCYFDLLWRFHDNSKHSVCRFSLGNKSGWCKRPQPALKMCCEISHARRDTHSWDWRVQGHWQWWQNSPFGLDIRWSLWLIGFFIAWVCLILASFDGLHHWWRWFLFFSKNLCRIRLFFFFFSYTNSQIKNSPKNPKKQILEFNIIAKAKNTL